MDIHSFFRKDFARVWGAMGNPHRVESCDTEPGIPDYIAFLNGTPILLEMKSHTDSIRQSQIDYTSKHRCRVLVLKRTGKGKWKLSAITNGIHVTILKPTGAECVARMILGASYPVHKESSNG